MPFNTNFILLTTEQLLYVQLIFQSNLLNTSSKIHSFKPKPHPHEKIRHGLLVYTSGSHSKIFRKYIAHSQFNYRISKKIKAHVDFCCLVPGHIKNILYFQNTAMKHSSDTEKKQNLKKSRYSVRRRKLVLYKMRSSFNVH